MSDKDLDLEQKALKYKEETDNKHINDMYSYGLMLYSGNGVTTNKEEAARYFKMAADGGHIDAMYIYGWMLRKGEGVTMNKEEAARYYKMAADEGHVDAIYNYAKMLENGEGIKINKEEEVKYYKMAADKGHVEAMHIYAWILDEGYGIPVDKKEAAKYYKMAADNGQTNAMYNYAVMLDGGDGIEVNKKEAVKYYKLAADKGIIEAMFNYAWILDEGDGIEVNKKEAAKYYKLAADKGHVEAMYNYAEMLTKGKGVTADNEEATKYCKMAVDNGNIEAKELLINIDRINFLKSKGYKNLGELGKGGFGKVYKMEKDSKSYAVKIPNDIKGNTKTPEQLKEDEELQTLIDLAGGGHTKKIDGFNIKQEGKEEVYQIEVLKLRKKNDLRKILESKKENVSKFSLISQLAVAYKKLHSNGIVHRDIKPENILFNGNKRIKTADYGLSGIGKINSAIGTPFYMAPEVFNGYIDEKSDVYSMGIMFLEILTGKIDLDLMGLTKDEEKRLSSSDNYYSAIVEFRNCKEIKNNELKKLIYRVSIKDLFPSTDGKEEIIGEIREKLVELITGMLEKNPKTRLSSNQVAEKCGEIFKICNLSTEKLEGYGIFNKDLYAFGIFNKDTLEYQKNKIKGDLELLKGKNPNNQKEQSHLDTFTGKKKLSLECKICLGNLLECFTEEGEINLNLDNKAFKENMEKIRKSGNQREYLLLVNKILDIKELKKSNEIFRLEEMENGMEEKRQIEEKKEELEKLKEERGLIMQEHIKLSRSSSNTEEKSIKAKEELEKLVKVSEVFSSPEEKRGMEKS